ncbi:MAG: hypothetical protein QM831_34690 [Kofleriaceae bacterium]
MNPLRDVYGELLVVRPPVPATVNKAGANYKSEVTHLTYSPRRAYDEWLSILDAIRASGGDAIYRFEELDEPFLDKGDLHVDGDGNIAPKGSNEVLGNISTVMTGRVFAANGPWVTRTDGKLRAVMMNMLAHRQAEAPYYQGLLEALAGEAGLALEVTANPHRWEGMADVATVGDRVVLTYAVPGHYDRDTARKSSRSTRDGVKFAADSAGVPEDARIYVELVYPHFHGDTVHFGARPTNRDAVLVHYKGGLFDGNAKIVADALGENHIVPIDRDDAVEQYAGNSRQVANGVLVPDGVSKNFTTSIEALGLATHRVPLFELFGKAGGGPACATLYLPRTLSVPTGSPLRYSASVTKVRSRRDRLPESLTVDPQFFDGKTRG